MKLLTLRDLFEAVERIENEQAAHAGALHHIADAVDRVERCVRKAHGTSADADEMADGARGDCAA